MNVSKVQLKEIRDSIDAALAQVAQKHGLQSLRSTRCTYSSAGSFDFKVEGLFGGGLSPEAQRYQHYASLRVDRMPPLGWSFSTGGHTYEVSGMNTTGTKVLATRKDDGKQYLWKTDAIAQHYALQAKKAG